MGIVKISDTLHEDLRLASAVMSRSINAQAEHWIRLGMLAELHPQATYHDLLRQMLRQEQATLQALLQ
ncbi:ParD-like family protein [Pseudomonas entomophila]|uniref:ParD-like family protein n=1 Tax=Pseudomonas entomophila TaxID=312306 RepID=UPI0015E4172C|nr:ParD-like family protein [Pseudomonas entomophila]MBA1190969.1 ParD-like family protein [Pseudomonas entomophila]